MRLLLAACLCLPLALAQAAQDPQQLVQQTTDNTVSKIKAERDKLTKQPELVYGYIEEIVLPHFDFKAMAGWVVGKYWRDASDVQKEKFTQEFRMLLVRTYAKAIIDNVDRDIVITPVRSLKPGDAEVTVHSEVAQSSGPPIPIDYKMHLVNDAWKVFDVAIDNVSLVTNYRTSFAKDIRQDGLDKLIAKLADRNNQESHAPAKN